MGYTTRSGLIFRGRPGMKHHLVVDASGKLSVLDREQRSWLAQWYEKFGFTVTPDGSLPWSYWARIERELKDVVT